MFNRVNLILTFFHYHRMARTWFRYRNDCCRRIRCQRHHHRHLHLRPHLRPLPGASFALAAQPPIPCSGPFSLLRRLSVFLKIVFILIKSIKVFDLYKILDFVFVSFREKKKIEILLSEYSKYVYLCTQGRICQ